MSLTRGLSRPALIAVSLLTALALTGCGNGSPTARSSVDTKKAAAFAALSGKKIVAAGAAAMKKTGTSHISGNITENGARLDLDVQSDGKGTCAGSFGSKGATATFVSTPGSGYLKANQAFWEQNAGSKTAADQTIKLLNGRWAKIPASDKFAAICTLGQKLFDSADDTKSAYTVGKLSELNGHQVIELSATTGTEKYRLYIRTDEPHQLLKIVSDTVGDTGEVTFDFDKSVDITVPTAEDALSLG